MTQGPVVSSVMSIAALRTRECLRSRRHRMHGQDSNATERQALLGSHALARQNLAAKGAWKADRSRERHGWRSIGVRVRPSRHLAAPAILDWSIVVGQAAQE